MSPFEIFFFTKIVSINTLLLCLAVLGIALVSKGARRKAATLALSTMGMMTTVVIVKNYFQVPRPMEALVVASGYAFPSGHAAGVVFLALVVVGLAWGMRQRYRYTIFILTALLVALVAYSRIMLQVHTWPQVFAGAAVGAIFGFLFIYFSRKVN